MIQPEPALRAFPREQEERLGDSSAWLPEPRTSSWGRSPPIGEIPTSPVSPPCLQPIPQPPHWVPVPTIFKAVFETIFKPAHPILSLFSLFYPLFLLDFPHMEMSLNLEHAFFLFDGPVSRNIPAEAERPSVELPQKDCYTGNSCPGGRLDLHFQLCRHAHCRRYSS